MGLGKNFSRSQVEPSLMARLQGDVHERVGWDCAHFLIRSTAGLNLEPTDKKIRTKHSRTVTWWANPEFYFILELFYTGCNKISQTINRTRVLSLHLKGVWPVWYGVKGDQWGAKMKTQTDIHPHIHTYGHFRYAHLPISSVVWGEPRWHMQTPDRKAPGGQRNLNLGVRWRWKPLHHPWN